MQFANNLLNQFKGNEQAWLCVDKIIEHATDNNVKFFALQILDEAINVSLYDIENFWLLMGDLLYGFSLGGI